MAHGGCANGNRLTADLAYGEPLPRLRKPGWTCGPDPVYALADNRGEQCAYS